MKLKLKMFIVYVYYFISMTCTVLVEGYFKNPPGLGWIQFSKSEWDQFETEEYSIDSPQGMILCAMKCFANPDCGGAQYDQDAGDNCQALGQDQTRSTDQSKTQLMIDIISGICTLGMV